MTGLVRKTGLKIYVLWYSSFAQKILASFPNFYKTVEKKRGPFDATTYPYWHMKVARYNFSGSIPAKFEHKLRRHKQTFGKIATTVVLDKDENLLWSGLQRHRSWHSNEMTLLPIQQYISTLATVLPKPFRGTFFFNSGLDVREV